MKTVQILVTIQYEDEIPSTRSTDEIWREYLDNMVCNRINEYHGDTPKYVVVIVPQRERS